MPSLVSNTGRLVTTDKEKAEVLKNFFFFASVFTSDCSANSPQADGLKGGNWGCNAPPTVSKNHVDDYLKNLNIHKSLGP